MTNEYLEVFVQEAREHCATLERRLLDLEARPDDKAALDDLFRAAHTLKGMAATVGYPKVAEVAHRAESAMDAVRKRTRSLDRALLDALLSARDWFANAVEEIAAGRPEPDGGPVEARLAAALATSTGARLRAKVTLDPASPLKGARAIVVLRALERLGRVVSATPTVEACVAGLAPEAVVAEVETAVTPDAAHERLAALFDVVAVEVAAVGAPRPAAPAPPAAVVAPAPAPAAASGMRASSVRVSTDRLDTLVNTVGELVIAKSRLTEVGRGVEDAELSDALDRLDRLTTDLYEHVLGARMLPLGNVYDRFPRMVRDTAAELGKEVELVLKGRDTELDRSVSEEVADPLMHLLRNALDHGVETPDERERAGKPRRGTVTVETRREHSRVVIDVADDGRGIDPVRIRDKAVALGLVSRTEADALPLNDVYLLLCRPGFSTAERVTATSGRGVGMDVVKNWVESVGGSLRITSEPGQGTRTTLRLPLTLAILQALLVRVGSERYLVPLDSVEATVDLRAAGLRTLHGHEVFMHEEEIVPLVRLARTLGVPDAGDGRYAVVVERHGRKAGLAVDEVLLKQEVVVKTLDRRVMSLPGIGGGTVLGDGAVALILDVGGLVGA